MKTLVVGAGAVGQVYGKHLAQGGAEVYYFVKEKYAAETRRGFTFYPLNQRGARKHAEHLALRPEQVLTTMAEVSAHAWDQVYLCVSSPALRGAWLDALVAAIGEATIVVLQPGGDDVLYVTERVPVARVVTGMITLASYHAPLPGETVPEPGMAYWFPPLAPSPIAGERAQAVAKALRAGGLPAKAKGPLANRAEAPRALFMTLLTALEAAGWSFATFARGGRLAEALAGAREAYDIIDADRRSRRRLSLVTPFALRAFLFLAPKFVPFDLQAMIRAHFTKVVEQTRVCIDGYIARGRELNLPTATLEALENQVAGAPARMRLQA